MSELRNISLLLNPVDPKTLRAVGSKLRPQDYENVLLERNLGKFCGYPLCHNPPREQKSPYKILYRKGKIYDQRKLLRFCSVDCFKKSSFFAAQLSSEPLWLRNTQIALDIHLLDDVLESSLDADNMGFCKDIINSGPNTTCLNSNANSFSTKNVDRCISYKISESESNMDFSDKLLPIIEKSSSTMKYNVVERFPDVDHKCIEGFSVSTDKWLK
ncbi:hypothetical protein PORY_002826 [Pneumocystis oryctolagi]|uniref:Uncharacterized protein n=1 Tax=Pneumocystis oryctolagi TaxID=42067 RepID=A0ACB7C837_9ASCO|nr:hypothetical protein PORY_002826 [Pneumocystis oryctolagi]